MTPELAHGSRRLVALLLLALSTLAQAASPPPNSWTMRAPGAKRPPAAPATATFAKTFASDPTGDAFGSNGLNYDITSINADLVNGSLLVTINFANAILPPDRNLTDSLAGYIDIDVDGRSDETASNLIDNCPSSQLASIGTDYFLFLFTGSTSSTPVVNFDSNQSVGNASTEYTRNALTITVPLSLIGASNAQSVRIATVLGNKTQPTDCAPNGAALLATAAAVGPPIQVSGTMQAGSTLTLRAPSGGSRYDWDLDADGVIDRTGTSSALDVTYPGAYNGNVSVLMTDAEGQRTISNLTVATAAPKLTATLDGTPTASCGDGDGQPEPGETWSVPVRITNTGNAASDGGGVLFAPADRVAAAAQGASVDGALTVQTPVVDVGALAPGQSVTANVLVSFSTSAQCGATLGLLASGGFDRVSSSAGSGTPLASFSVPSACQVYTGACGLAANDKALVTPRQGLYYNTTRPGNGLSNFVIPVAGGSPVYFGAWFTGAVDHTPTWYIVQGSLVGNTVVAPIYRFTRNLGASTFAVNSSVVGQAIVTLKSTEQIAFLWQIGTKSGLELMNYLTPGPAASPNRTGAWFNPNESGWGQVVHDFSLGGQNTLFTVDYLYDAAGEPRWVLTQTTESAAIAGSAHSTYAVHCPGCPWIADWNSFPLAAGSGSEQFFNATSGQTSTSYTLPVPLTGTWVRNALPLSLLTVPQ